MHMDVVKFTHQNFRNEFRVGKPELRLRPRIQFKTSVKQSSSAVFGGNGNSPGTWDMVVTSRQETQRDNSRVYI